MLYVEAFEASEPEISVNYAVRTLECKFYAKYHGLIGAFLACPPDSAVSTRSSTF